MLPGFDKIPEVKPEKENKPQYFIYCEDGLGGLLFLKREGHADVVNYELVLHGNTRKKPSRWKSLRRAKEVLQDIEDAEWWRWYELKIGNYGDIDKLAEKAVCDD